MRGHTLYVCMYAYVLACVLSTHVFLCACERDKSECAYMCVCVCMYVCVRVCMHVCMNVSQVHF
jgi:hypothetical protein